MLEVPGKSLAKTASVLTFGKSKSSERSYGELLKRLKVPQGSVSKVSKFVDPTLRDCCPV